VRCRRRCADPVALGEADEQLALAARGLPGARSRRELEEGDELVEPLRACRVADDVVDVGDAVELPGVHHGIVPRGEVAPGVARPPVGGRRTTMRRTCVGAARHARPEDPA